MIKAEKDNKETQEKEVKQEKTVSEDIKKEKKPEKKSKKETKKDKKEEQVSKEIELGNKLNEINDKYLRLYSEFDNYRKRTSKERLELFKTAASDMVVSLLPVLDDLERGLKSFSDAKDIDSLKEGIELIYNKFNNIMTQKGVESIDSIGEVFDTDLHEAITNIPAPSDDMKGKVIDETEKGYKLNGKVIRFAKVVVGA